MPMLIIDLDKAPQALLGNLSRRLLEIRPGAFVGSLSARAIEQTWAAVVAANPGSAMLVKPAKNELGLDFRTIGNHRYAISHSHGVSLVSFLKSEKTHLI